MFIPRLEVIAGCMFSGKTEELIRRIKRSRISGLGTLTFKPQHDTRVGAEIKSRNGDALEAIVVADPKQMLEIVGREDLVIGIDEAQFFNHDLIPVTLALIRQGKRVIVSGLDLDYREQPFEVVSMLMALASPVDKLTAVCMKCKQREASRSQRLSDDHARVVIGDRDYEPRCLVCYVPPK